MCHAKIFQLYSKWCTSIESRWCKQNDRACTRFICFAVHEEMLSHWMRDELQLKQYQANWEKAQAQGTEIYRWGIGNMYHTYHTMILISRLSRQYNGICIIRIIQWYWFQDYLDNAVLEKQNNKMNNTNSSSFEIMTEQFIQGKECNQLNTWHLNVMYV
jgi:uncharacterized membrane protein YbaN (DUF454 family)